VAFNKKNCKNKKWNYIKKYYLKKYFLILERKLSFNPKINVIFGLHFLYVCDLKISSFSIFFLSVFYNL